MVFSTGIICPKCKELGDFVNKNNDYQTRALFYNNGRKTLSKEENKELVIISKDGIIKNANVLIGNNIELYVSENKINIWFDYLDAKNLFIIEIEHNGYLEIKGRISETGKILNTEPRNWTIVNILFFTLSLGSIFYTFYEFINTKSLIEKIPIGINIFIIFLICFLLRFIHSLYFIPDNISHKYLNSKSKLKNGFITELQATSNSGRTSSGHLS